MAHRADGLNDIFEHDVLVREEVSAKKLKAKNGTIDEAPTQDEDIANKKYVDEAISNIPSPDLSGLVPYTGATANVDIGTRRYLGASSYLGTSGGTQLRIFGNELNYYYSNSLVSKWSNSISPIAPGYHKTIFQGYQFGGIAPSLEFNGFTAGITFNNDTNVVGNLTATNLSGTNTGDQDLSGLVPYTGANNDIDLDYYTLTTTGDINAGYFLGSGEYLTDLRTNMLYDSNAGSPSIFAQNYELTTASKVEVAHFFTEDPVPLSPFIGTYYYDTQHNGFPSFDNGDGKYIYFDSYSNYWIISEEYLVPLAELEGDYIKGSSLSGSGWYNPEGSEYNEANVQTSAPIYMDYSGNYQALGSRFVMLGKKEVWDDETLVSQTFLPGGFSAEVDGEIVNFGVNFGQLEVYGDRSYPGGFLRIDIREGMEQEFLNLKYLPVDEGEQQDERTIFGVTTEGELWSASAGLFGYGVDSGVSNWDGNSVVQANGDITTTEENAFNLGNPNENGSWRIIRSGDNLVMQRRESDTWVTKQTINA